MNLTGKQRQMLRALAHSLTPVVQIGHGGLSDAVIAQIDEALTAHELIKIKLGKECPISIEDAAPKIEQGTRSLVIQCLGRVITVFRRNQTKPKLPLAIKDLAKAERTPLSKLSGRQLRGSLKRKRAGSKKRGGKKSPIRSARPKSTGKKRGRSS